MTARGEDSLPWQVKPLVELMLALTTLARHGIRDRTLANLVQCASKHGAEFDWHQLAAYDASAATVLATVADFFTSNSLALPFELEFVSFLHRIAFFEGMDRVPYREMDLSYSLGLLFSSSAFGAEIPIWFSGTTFGKRQHITRYTIDDLYSLTHAAFFLTGFGRDDLKVLADAATAARFRKELVALTGVMLRSDNVDVLGELLLCWLFCEVENTPINKMIFNLGLERLLNATTAEGLVAPTSRMYERAQKGEASFLDVYHTTLVCAMAFALIGKSMPYVH